MLGTTIGMALTPAEATIQQSVLRIICTIIFILILLTSATILGTIAGRVLLNWIENKARNSNGIVPSFFRKKHNPYTPELFRKWNEYQSKARQQYQKKEKEFLSTAEKEFKKYLRQNLPANIEIHCKVRLADILKSETKFRRIIMMHVDYVLIDEESQNIILAIELDDESHNTPEARERDAIKNNVLDESGIKYTRIPNDQKYHPAIIKNIVEFCKMKIATTDT